MQKVYAIGTLHGGLTPEHELQAVLEELQPDRLLVEIFQGDIEKENIQQYPSEMIFAYNFGKSKGIPVYGFDSKIEIFKNNFTNTDNEKLLFKQTALMKDLSWKDMNKSKNDRIIAKPMLHYISKSLWKKREEEMLENIRKHIPKKGIVVVLTGTGHLDYLEKHLKEAKFPYR